MTRPHPQRIVRPSPIGSLLKSSTPPAAPRRDDGYQDRAYLAQVRELPCLKCGLEPCGEAAHVRFASAAFGVSSGMGRKPPDRLALPLCGDCHREGRDAQHKRNEEAFWRELGINPHLVCERLYAQRGDLVAMRAVIFVMISERSHQK